MTELRRAEEPLVERPTAVEEAGESVGEPEEPGRAEVSYGGDTGLDDEAEPLEPEDARDADAEESLTSDADEPALQGALMDRVRGVFGGRTADHVREISEVVDKPEFQVPEKMFPPDRYGTPLDRPDGTRTPLFDGVPTREQTKQGALGDCGVIATLGAVAAHRPEDIMAAVRENEDGTYEVRLHGAKSVGIGRYEPTGEVIKLTVTPDLPVYDESPDEPVFADSVSTGSAWAPIMEKAIAGVDQTWDEEREASWRSAHNRPDDLRTGYVRLNDGTKSGERAELMVQLTGQPAETWDLPEEYDYEGRSPKRQVLDHLAEKLDNNCPIVVGTKKSEDERVPHNLVAGHAYEISDVDDRGLIHLRNPYNSRHPEPLKYEDFKTYCLPFYTTLEPR